VQNVHNEIKPTTNVMLPPGTDSQTVRRAGDAAADGALRSVRDLAASHASLVPQAGVTP
jgi:hypothetical protein